METKDKIFIFVILTALLSGYVIYSMPLDERMVPVKFSISNKTGFDLTTEELNFGAVNPNQSSIRTLIIENLYNKKINIVIKSSEEISKNVIASESNFQLEPFEAKVITFTLFTEGLEEFREYNGNIIVVSKRATNLNIRKILE